MKSMRKKIERRMKDEKKKDEMIKKLKEVDM